MIVKLLIVKEYNLKTIIDGFGTTYIELSEVEY